MQELAGGALLAQAAHPVLADQTVIRTRGVVLVGTRVTEWAVALFERLACRPVGVEAEAVFSLEEGVEFEGEVRRVGGRVEELVEDGRDGHGVMVCVGVGVEYEMRKCLQQCSSARTSSRHPKRCT